MTIKIKFKINSDIYMSFNTWFVKIDHIKMPTKYAFIEKNVGDKYC